MATKTAAWIGMHLSGGRYEVIEKISEGGMGYVYKVRDQNLDTDVVVKVPRKSMLEDPEFAARFTREIRSLVKLAHPHIVKISDVGEHEGMPFAVMQFLSGGNLRDRVRIVDGKRQPLRPDEFLDWIEPIADALDFIHKQNYIHRDVKPDNILFDSHGNSFLSDFGVAKALGTPAGIAADPYMTTPGIVVGTPQYMAPELLVGAELDGKVDQFAFAVTLYELLAGRLPFDGATPAAIFVQQNSNKAPLLHTLTSKWSARVSAIVHQGLHREPAKRHPDCKTLAVLLAEELRQGSGPGEGSRMMRKPAATTLPPDTMSNFACPACGKTLRMPSTAIGKKGRCPTCFASFTIGDRSEQSAPARASSPEVIVNPDQSRTETKSSASPVTEMTPATNAARPSTQQSRTTTPARPSSPPEQPRPTTTRSTPATTPEQSRTAAAPKTPTRKNWVIILIGGLVLLVGMLAWAFVIALDSAKKKSTPSGDEKKESSMPMSKGIADIERRLWRAPAQRLPNGIDHRTIV